MEDPIITNRRNYNTSLWFTLAKLEDFCRHLHVFVQLKKYVISFAQIFAKRDTRSSALQ